MLVTYYINLAITETKKMAQKALENMCEQLAQQDLDDSLELEEQTEEDSGAQVSSEDQSGCACDQKPSTSEQCTEENKK